MVIDITRKNNCPINESAKVMIYGSIIGTICLAIAAKIIKDRKKVRDEKERIKNEKEEKLKKEIAKFIETTPEMKAAKNELYNFGDKVGNAVAKHLREFAKKEGLSKNKNFHMSDIKYDPINGFDVQVSSFQSGMDDDAIDEWERNNPGKNWEDDETINNDYYYKLLTEGEECVKGIFITLNKENKYKLAYVDTGDCDEGHIFIDIVFSDSYDTELKTLIEEKYRNEIDKITARN